MQLILVVLLACRTSAPPLPGTLIWVSEDDGVPTSMWAAAATPEARKKVGTDGSFPGAADPLGTHALLVAVTEDAEGHHEQLVLVPLAGGTPVMLGPRAGMVRNPAWSADGSFVAVESNLASFRDLYRVGRDGTGWARLTDHPHGNYEPSIAPDGALTFVSSRDGNAELYVAKPDGSDPLRLTLDVGDDTNPAWSPDGERIAWLARRGESVTVYTLARGESGGTPLRSDHNPSDIDRELVWNPKGDRLAVTTQIGPKDSAIDLLALDGRRLARIDGPNADEHPTWSPDGQWLAFSSAREGTPEIWVTDRDGGSVRKLVSSTGAAWLPRWLPR